MAVRKLTVIARIPAVRLHSIIILISILLYCYEQLMECTLQLEQLMIILKPLEQ
jgi:hypothetical protein